MSDALPLPARPNLEQYKKLAKELQQACRSADAASISGWARRWLGQLNRLRKTPDTPDTADRIERETQRMVARWQRFTERHSRAARCLLADAQYFIALEHEFASWPKFVAHLEALTQDDSAIARFEKAADAIVTGDLKTLKRLLRQQPGLVRARSSREHQSTLLHYVSANGVEDWRQLTPPNIVEITRTLLDAGAEVNATSTAYGGGSTTLGLTATSIHPEQARVQIALLELLMSRGAAMEQPGLAGNDHGAIKGCLANGQGEAARFFAERGAPMDLEDAAGVGRLDAVRTHFDDTGALRPPSTRAQLDSGFLYACGYGRNDVVRFLLERGADPGTRNDASQTGLHWAAYGPHIEVVKMLLEAGAPVNVADALQHTPLDWAIGACVGAGTDDQRRRGYEMVARLIRAGAVPDLDRLRPRTRERVTADEQLGAALRGELR
jgi:hypothetical protein